MLLRCAAMSAADPAVIIASVRDRLGQARLQIDVVLDSLAFSGALPADTDIAITIAIHHLNAAQYLLRERQPCTDADYRRCGAVFRDRRRQVRDVPSADSCGAAKGGLSDHPIGAG
jgi:hypothetical protein